MIIISPATSTFADKDEWGYFLPVEPLSDPPAKVESHHTEGSTS